MDKISHPYQVRTWLPDEPSLKFLGKARWSVICRCESQDQAEYVARALRHAYHSIIAVVKFGGDGAGHTTTEYIAWYPDRQTVEQAAKDAEQ